MQDLDDLFKKHNTVTVKKGFRFQRIFTWDLGLFSSFAEVLKPFEVLKTNGYKPLKPRDPGPGVKLQFFFNTELTR